MNNNAAIVAASGGTSGQGDLSIIAEFFQSRCAADWDDPTGIDLAGCFPVSGKSFAADPMSACTLDPLVPVARADDLSEHGNIVSCAGIEHRAGISVWASDEEVAGYSTWQVQQLRRAAKTLGPWRDSLIRKDELLALTWGILAARGAVQREAA